MSYGTYNNGQVVPQQTLTDNGGSIAVDGSLSNNFELELDTGGGTLQAPTNVHPGYMFTIAIRQDSTGGYSLGFAAAYKFAGGYSTIPTTALAEVLISCYVRAVGASGTATSILAVTTETME